MINRKKLRRHGGTPLGVLAPVAEAEFSYGQAANLAVFGIGSTGMGDEPEFPEEDGPISQLGTLALIDAMWAVIGEDPLQEVLGVLTPLLDEALPELGAELCKSGSASVLQVVAA